MEITVSNICKSYNKKEILSGVSLSFVCGIDKGECIGLLGANGSGKSTLLSILAGIVKCDSGTFDFSGQKIGYIPQTNPLVEELTAYDNLRLWYSKSELKSELENGFLKELGLNEYLNKTVSKLSGGMKKRLSIGCGIAGKPNVLLLDEPTAALDLVYKKKLIEFYKKFTNNGGTIILVTHDIQEFQACDRYYLLQDGKLSDFHYSGDLNSLADVL